MSSFALNGWFLSESYSAARQFNSKGRPLPLAIKTAKRLDSLLIATISTTSPPRTEFWYAGGYCYQIVAAGSNPLSTLSSAYIGERIHTRLGNNLIFPNTDFGEYQLEFIAPIWFASMQLEIYQNVQVSIDDALKTAEDVLRLVKNIYDIVSVIGGAPPLPPLPPASP